LVLGEAIRVEEYQLTPILSDLIEALNDHLESRRKVSIDKMVLMVQELAEVLFIT
jgi:hypothetical protein